MSNLSLKKQPKVFYDETLFRYVIDLDLVRLPVVEKYPYLPILGSLIDVIQDHRNSWEDIRQFIGVDTRSELFEMVAHKNDDAQLSKYKDLCTLLEKRYYLNTSSNVLYLYADGKKPSSSITAGTYSAVAIQNLVPTYVVVKDEQIHPLNSIVVHHPDSIILTASLSVDFGYFKHESVEDNTDRKQITFIGTAERLTILLREVVYVGSDEVTKIAITLDDGMDLAGSIVSDMVLINQEGSAEEALPQIMFSPARMSFGATHGMHTYYNCLKFVGNMDDIVSARLKSSDPNVTYYPSGKSPYFRLRDGVYDLEIPKASLGSDLNLGRINIYRNGTKPQSNTVELELTLSEKYNSQIVSAVMDVKQEQTPEPEIIWNTDEIVIPADATEITLLQPFYIKEQLAEQYVSYVYFATDTFNGKIFKNPEITYGTDLTTAGGQGFLGANVELINNVKLVFYRNGDEAKSGTVIFGCIYGEDTIDFPITIRQEAKA